MTTSLVQGINVALLALIWIGVPAVASAQIGSIRLTSMPIAHQLALAGAGIAVSFNVICGWRLFRKQKARRICWSWAGIHFLLGVVQFLYLRGVIGFGWLKELLVRMSA